MPREEFDKWYDTLTGGQKKAFLSKTMHGDSLLFEQIMGDYIKLVVEDDRFVLGKSFEITIPRFYDYRLGIEVFLKEVKDIQGSHGFLKKSVGDQDELISFLHRRIVVSNTYIIKLFELTKKISPEHCMWFLKRQNSLSVDPLMIGIIWSFIKEDFNKNLQDRSRVIAFNYGMRNEELERDYALLNLQYSQKTWGLMCNEGKQNAFDLLPEHDLLMCICNK